MAIYQINYGEDLQERLHASDEKHAMQKFHEDFGQDENIVPVPQIKVVDSTSDIVGNQALLDIFGRKSVSKELGESYKKNRTRGGFINVDHTFFNCEKISRLAYLIAALRKCDEDDIRPRVYFEPFKNNNARIAIIVEEDELGVILFRSSKYSHSNYHLNETYTWFTWENAADDMSNIELLWHELDLMSARETLIRLNQNKKVKK